MKINKKLKEIMDLTSETFNLSLYYFSKEDNKCLYKNKRIFEEEGSFDFEPDMRLLIDIIKESRADIPKIILTPYYENYIVINIKSMEKENGVLIVGPSLYKKLNKNDINSISSCLPEGNKKEFIERYERLPVVPFDKLNNIARNIYFMIYEKYITVEDIIEENFYDINTIAKARGRFNRDFSGARQNSEIHNTYERERLIFDCIRRGDTKALLYNLNRPLDGSTGILAKGNPLRSEKNISVSMAAVAVRIIIEEGLAAGLAYGVNDSYIQLIEEASSIEQVKSLMITMLCDFSNLLKESKELNYSQIIKGALDYIYVNLYEKISVEDISKKMNCNTNYLSRAFKKEVGRTIGEFITYERVEEAKRLLKFTKFSIMDIAVLMQFNDQSHFTRVFKRETGITPKKYRDQH